MKRSVRFDLAFCNQVVQESNGTLEASNWRSVVLFEKTPIHNMPAYNGYWRLVYAVSEDSVGIT